jgi:hypothetical protein
MVGRGIALLFHDRGNRRERVVSIRPWPYLTPGKDPVPIVQEAGWAPGPVWTGGKSRPTGFRSPDRPTRSQSLYRLSYPAHHLKVLETRYVVQHHTAEVKARKQAKSFTQFSLFFTEVYIIMLIPPWFENRNLDFWDFHSGFDEDLRNFAVLLRVTLSWSKRDYHPSIRRKLFRNRQCVTSQSTWVYP